MVPAMGNRMGRPRHPLRPTREPSTALLPLPQAARWLGISPNALRSRVRRGQIPCLRLGRRKFIVVEQLRAWLSAEARAQTNAQAREQAQAQAQTAAG